MEHWEDSFYVEGKNQDWGRNSVASYQCLTAGEEQATAMNALTCQILGYSPIQILPMWVYHSIPVPRHVFAFGGDIFNALKYGMTGYIHGPDPIQNDAEWPSSSVPWELANE